MNSFLNKLIEQARQDNVQKLSVGGVLLHEGKLLILKRCAHDFMPNIYELPGGGLEAHESLIQALERELHEETNCTIDKLIGYVGHLDFPSSDGLLTRRFNFLIYPKTPFLIQLTEHQDHCWILPEDADQYEITPQTRRIILCIAQDKIHRF